MGNTPNIRFKGFTDDWEQRKLNEVAEFNPKSELPDEFEYVDLESVVGTEMISHRTETKDSAPSRAQRLAQPGDVFFQTVRPYQKNNYLFSKLDNNYVFSTGYAQMRPNIDTAFLMSFLQTDSFVKIVLDNCTGTSYPAINSSDLSNLEISLPKSFEEQKKVGKTIISIDNLITLHQRKCDETKKLKKFMLQKMFPKKDAKKPEIRFAGFTNDWEQRKFGDVGSVAMCKRIFKEQTSDEGEVPFYKIGTFGGEPDAFISRKLFDEYKTKYPYPHKGDILISASGSIGRTIEFTGKDEYFQDSNIVWLKHENEIDNNFLKVLYSIVEWSCEGSTIKRLYNDNFLKTEFMLPQIDEQIKLGDYFANLDNLITLHQRKSFLYFSRINDWEQRKLNEYLQVSKVKNKDAAFSKEDVLSVSGDYGIVNQIEFQGRSFAGVSVAAYGVVETGDVVYTKSPLKSNPYGIIKTNKGKTGIVSTLYAVYKPLNNVHSEFVQIYFEQDARMNNYMHSLVNKGAKNDMKVSDENALKGEVFFPSKDEQIKISKYFGKIDHLIALHRRAYYNKKGGLTNVHNDNQQYYAIL